VQIVDANIAQSFLFYAEILSRVIHVHTADRQIKSPTTALHFKPVSKPLVYYCVGVDIVNKTMRPVFPVDVIPTVWMTRNNHLLSRVCGVPFSLDNPH